MIIKKILFYISLLNNKNTQCKILHRLLFSIEGRIHMIKKTFDLTKDSQILIYGCGAVGQSIAKALINEKYRLCGFIEKDGDSTKRWEGIPILGPSHLGNLPNLENYIAFVTLNNGMLHDQIAYHLYKSGISHIIYSPMQSCYSYEGRQMMRKAYKRLFHKDFAQIKNIPSYAFLNERAVLSNFEIIDDSTSGVISFWCPIKDIRCNIFENFDFLPPEAQKYMVPELLKYQGQALEQCVPYINLFKWLRGEKVDLLSYLHITGHYLPEEHNQWLKSRKELFLIYEDALKHDLIFFTDAPSTVFWNPKGHFHLLDGMTRASYLISVGYLSVPVCVSTEDYYKWRIYKESLRKDKQEGDENTIERIPSEKI